MKVENFLSSLLLDQDRETYHFMNTNQKKLVRLALLFPTSEDQPKWEFFKSIGIYSIWFFMDTEDIAVYQLTKGECPRNLSGYRNLDSLLKLKGLRQL